MASFKFNNLHNLLAGDGGLSLELETDTNLFIGLYSAVPGTNDEDDANLGTGYTEISLTNYTAAKAVGSGGIITLAWTPDTTNDWTDLVQSGNLAWTSLAAGTVDWAILFRNTVDAQGDTTNAIGLVAWDLTAENNPNGNDYTLVFNSEGLVRVGGIV